MEDAKTTYAQSSDIKARTYRQYRHDMKKKAIVELEIKPFLQDLMQPGIVSKYGTDKELWFRRAGGITQDPDYIVEYPNDEKMLIEFQYAETIEKLKFIDFKVSKVGLKPRGVKTRTPYSDRIFFYIDRSGESFAFIEPIWIIRNGKKGTVSAWGNRNAIRVPKSKFQKLLTKGNEHLRESIVLFESKKYLLEAQTSFLSNDSKRFARVLDMAVDKHELIKVAPNTLEGFYRVCFLLERMNEKPKQANLWLINLIAFFKSGIKPLDFAKWIFAFDFLYFHCPYLQEHEKATVNEALEKAWDEISSWEYREGSFERDNKVSKVDETCAVLHVVNLLEDIQQDFSVEHGYTKRVNKIFDALPDAIEISSFLKSNENDEVLKQVN